MLPNMIASSWGSNRLPSSITRMSVLSADLTVITLLGLAAAKTAILINKETKRVKIVFIHFVFKVNSKSNCLNKSKPHATVNKIVEEKVKGIPAIEKSIIPYR